MRRKHHLRVKRMGRTPSLTGLELSILLYLHGDFERSDEEIMTECHGIERESVRHAIRGLAGSEFIIRTKEEGLLLRTDCWLITYAGRQALKKWVSAIAPVHRTSRTRVPASIRP